MNIPLDSGAEESGRVSWWRRFGVLGFVFFLMKGLVWLGVVGATTWFGMAG